MFNPHPHITQVPIGDGNRCVVIDDFLADPQALRALAIAHCDGFDAAPLNAFPGLEMPMPDAFSARLNEFFIQHVRCLLGARRTLEVHSRLSIVTLHGAQLQPVQRVCHRDRFAVVAGQMAAACVLYLFDQPALGGTSFFRPRQPLAATNALMRALYGMSSAEADAVLGAEAGYLAASNGWFELVHTVPAAWNRAIFYDGSVFHSSHISDADRLAADPARGRLTLNGFFVCRRQAG
ncbi:DUF6445 family protein [Massilia psychrophila]|uniref:Uncharacterized protein n=1 Tax=Massilia psychrophila TaxID=1603353 RepID=A0A2G8T099_9BURK|nr:DUF6445 family protein [Massilia psychrophila]PIL39449.1 hypothetical protein CR103_12610 [Massilia psychrophila]GGE76709.1 hypothetical protein GCM10008020_21820 [Massilia psychrophila]